MLNEKYLVVSDEVNWGYFFIFELDSVDEIKVFVLVFKEYYIFIDFRGNCLWFGFGLYYIFEYIDLIVLN